MAAILQIVKSPYINEKSSDFDEIGYTTAHLELGDSHMTNKHFQKYRPIKTTDSRRFNK